MSVGDILNLKANESPVWTRGQNICDSQAIIRLRTYGHKEVLAPASSLLASSPLLKDILTSQDFPPVTYFAPVVILPDVKVEIAKHLVELVTIGKTYPIDRQVINKVKGAMKILQVSENFGIVGNVDSNVEDFFFEARAALIDNETCVKQEEEPEYIIKIEFDDNVCDVVENQTMPSESVSMDVSKNKTNCNKNKKKAKRDCSGQNDNDDQNPIVTGSGRKVINKLSRKKRSNKNERRVSGRLSRNKINLDNTDQFNDEDRTPVNYKIRSKSMTDKVDKEVKPFKCNLCTASFGWNSNLRQHMNLHSGVYSCEQCDYRSGSRAKLMNHKQGKHTDERYSCNKCEFSSKWFKYLVLHKRIAHEGYTYDCTQCTFKGKRSNQLLRHRQQVHEDIVYHCDLCSYKTKVVDNLKAHNYNCHKGKKK